MTMPKYAKRKSVGSEYFDTLFKCDRCGRKHRDIVFTPFRRPYGAITHWALCPRYKEPILMKLANGGTGP